MQGLTEGRMVHFVDPTGAHRAAVVAEVLDKELGNVVLTVFTALLYEPVITWVDIPFDGGAKPMTWHWIEQA